MKKLCIWATCLLLFALLAAGIALPARSGAAAMTEGQNRDQGSLPQQVGDPGLAIQAQEEIAGTVVAHRLNVRAGPGTGYAVVGQLAQDARVQIVQRQPGWYQIVYPQGAGGTAWVSASYVALDDAPTAAPSAAESTAVPSNGGLKGRLVFQEHNGGTIYVYDLESKALHALTGGFDPALSPDGKTVAVTRYGGQQGLYLIDVGDCVGSPRGCAAGRNEHLIFSGGQDLRTPAWSPDGRYILFSRVTGRSTCRQLGRVCVPDNPLLARYPLISLDKRGLSRVDVNGGDFRDIAALETAIAPDWNEAGIVYHSQDGIQRTADRPDASNQLVIGGFEYRYQDPDWQPNGGRIIFQSKEGSHWEIFSVQADGSGLVALTRPISVLVDELPQNVSPAWSPDGRSIVYLSNRDPRGSAGVWHLWVMDADGANQRLLDPEVLGQVEFRYDLNADQMVDWR